MFDKETEAKLEELAFAISAYARFPLTHGETLAKLEADYLAIVAEAEARQAD